MNSGWLSKMPDKISNISPLDGATQMYIGQRDGKTVAMAWKCIGKEGEKWNRRTLREWIKEGYDIQTVMKDECDKYYDEMRGNA
jgi:hypothetical protein